MTFTFTFFLNCLESFPDTELFQSKMQTQCSPGSAGLVCGEPPPGLPSPRNPISHPHASHSQCLCSAGAVPRTLPPPARILTPHLRAAESTAACRAVDGWTLPGKGFSVSLCGLGLCGTQAQQLPHLSRLEPIFLTGVSSEFHHVSFKQHY